MLVLEAGEGSLTIDDEDPGWCVCYLKADGRELNLGAECLKYLKEHLVSVLLDNGENAPHSHEGHPLVWGGSLSPLRFSLYMGIRERDRILFVRDDEADSGDDKFITRLNLTPEDIESWLKQLS
ncbi:MAG: hypothetical protein KC777_07990 [Cyanobacteria bacterium HKST-UBA02]|nr:hypothetical protein [Cyanobacteria bacterium HKST-UBA02]